jgi:hypothetical protein
LLRLSVNSSHNSHLHPRFVSCVYQSYHKLVPSHFCCLRLLNFSFAPLPVSDCPPTSAGARTRHPSPKRLALFSLVPLALGPLQPPPRISKLEAQLYYDGLPSKPRLIARTGPSWEAPSGPEAYPQLKELKTMKSPRFGRTI